ncbi:hypothetical protein Asru_0414_01 [Acidisphaera rubrifaciens HS-AP3]|uniref:Helix-turn-helix domain-containing protein n=1 Tax=Acidisphaera rubrifaciens HS-AP3 TaxID=1231350 RepID=A0A0D6P9Z2_9PROT|nr:hypothetical protein Asru_0414_01 [Acidisphaera rubrifaciens HS-AP3]
MSDATTSHDDDSGLLSGLLTRAQLAAELRCSERTIIRHERAGMPCIRLGIMRLYDAAKVREWVMSHEHRPQTPRVGRPAGKRAA